MALTMLWGVNYPVVKVTNHGLSPIFNSLLRSVIASILGIIYCLSVKQPIFHRDIRLFHGFMIGCFSVPNSSASTSALCIRMPHGPPYC